MEKASQIPLMADIYRGSKNTIIWLGPEGPNTGGAYQFLNSIAQKIEDTYGIQDFITAVEGRSAEHMQRLFFPRKVLRTVTPPPDPTVFGWLATQIPTDHGRWKPVFELLGRAYWDRVWVIQESVLGHEPLVQCGGYIISIRRLFSVVALAGILPVINSLFDSSDGYFVVSSIRNLRQRGIELDIFSLLRLTATSKATDARDMLYGVYGLTSNPATGGIGVPVSYQSSLDNCPQCQDDASHSRTHAFHLLHQAAIAGLKNSQDFSQLSLTSISLYPDVRLPSWVPDWTRHSKTFPFPHQPAYRHAQDFAFRHGYTHRFRPAFRGEADSELRVVAAKIGSIRTVSALCGKGTKTIKLDRNYGRGLSRGAVEGSLVYVKWIKMASSAKMNQASGLVADTYGDGSPVTALRELLVALSAESNDADMEEARNSFAHWLFWYSIHTALFRLGFYNIHWKLHNWVFLIIQMFLTLLRKLPPHPPPSYQDTHNRRLCLSHDGHLILAPGRTKPGDIIVLLQGGDRPFVLREVRGAPSRVMKLVGEACMPALYMDRTEDVIKGLAETPTEIWIQ